jgi:sec-independent protein translocase protein TatA
LANPDFVVKLNINYRLSLGGTRMNLGIGEIALLIVLALVLFGAKRLPEVGKAAGSAIREFKSALNDTGGKDADDAKKNSDE